MKFKLLLFCFMGLHLTLFSQYSHIKRTPVKEADVPEMVKEAQRKNFPDGFVTEWKFHTKELKVLEDQNYYTAIFKKGGRLRNHSYFDEKGTLLAYTLHIDSGNLPGDIQENAINLEKGSYIKSAELIDLENPKRLLYRVRLHNQGLLRYVYYDMNGRLIDKKNLPAQIFVFI